MEVHIYGESYKENRGMVGYVPQRESVDWDFPATVYDVVMMGRIREIGWLRWPRRVDPKDQTYTNPDNLCHA